MNSLEKFYYLKFKNYNLLKQLVIFTFFLLLIGEILEFALEFIYHKELFTLDFTDESIAYMFFEVVLLAPFIETLIFQFLLLELFLLIFLHYKFKYTISIIASGLIFGSLHLYNSAYMFATIFIGCYLGYIYVFYKKTKLIKSIYAVFIIHASYNLIVLIKDYLI